MKKPTCSKSTIPRLVWATPLWPPIIAIMILNRITPIMSSATAAPRIVAPSLVSNTLNSFSTSTEIETDVAEKMTPINSDSNQLNWKKRLASPIITTGKITPIIATIMAGRKYLRKSAKLLSSPPINISTTTPISENVWTKVVKWTQLSSAGPNITPTRISPITAGIPARWAKCPARVVAKINKQSIPKKSMCSPIHQKSYHLSYTFSPGSSCKHVRSGTGAHSASPSRSVDQ